MSTQTTGRAALVASNLPTSKTVSTASSGTPITVTTTTNHALNNNDVVSISGVSGNSAANGTFIVTVLSGTQVFLFAYPAGTAVAGLGAGTGGTLLSNGYGITVPVPNDLTDAEQAATVNVPFEALLDRSAWAAYMILGASTIPGNKTFSGNVTFSGVVTFSDQIVTTGIFINQGRMEYRSRLLLSDAPHTVDVTQADTFVLPNAPAATRLITLSMTVGTPLLGERIRFVVPALQHVTGTEYQWTRTGVPAGLLAKAISSASAIPLLPISVEFEFAVGLNLVVSGAASGTSGRVKLTLSFPVGWGGDGNPTDSLATGDTVNVSNVGGTTEANGTWVITVNDGSHITLTGTTFVNAWTSLGNVQIQGGVWRLGMNSGASYDGAAIVGVYPDAAS